MGKVTTDEKERLLKGSLTTKQVGIPTKARAGLCEMGWPNLGMTHMASQELRFTRKRLEVFFISLKQD